MSTVVVCVIAVAIYISISYLLEDKRMRIKSLKDKIQNRFNASIVEIAWHDRWQHHVLGISMINNEKRDFENLILNHLFVEQLEIRLKQV